MSVGRVFVINIHIWSIRGRIYFQLWVKRSTMGHFPGFFQPFKIAFFFHLKWYLKRNSFKYDFNKTCSVVLELSFFFCVIRQDWDPVNWGNSVKRWSFFQSSSRSIPSPSSSTRPFSSWRTFSDWGEYSGGQTKFTFTCAAYSSYPQWPTPVQSTSKHTLTPVNPALITCKGSL